MECSIDLYHSPARGFSFARADKDHHLHVSCDTSEPLEPFKLSTLSSPMHKIHDKANLQALFECYSPYPETSDPHNSGACERGRATPGSLNLDLFLDSALRKRETCLAEENDEALTEYKLNFSKQAHRVKYYWRGTSLARPFTFMRVRNEGEHVACEEDYSAKKVNPNDGLF